MYGRLGNINTTIEGPFGLRVVALACASLRCVALQLLQTAETCKCCRACFNVSHSLAVQSRAAKLTLAQLL